MGRGARSAAGQWAGGGVSLARPPTAAVHQRSAGLRSCASRKKRGGDAVKPGVRNAVELEDLHPRLDARAEVDRDLARRAHAGDDAALARQVARKVDVLPRHPREAGLADVAHRAVAVPPRARSRRPAASSRRARPSRVALVGADLPRARRRRAQRHPLLRARGRLLDVRHREALAAPVHVRQRASSATSPRRRWPLASCAPWRSNWTSERPSSSLGLASASCAYLRVFAQGVCSSELASALSATASRTHEQV